MTTFNRIAGIALLGLSSLPAQANLIVNGSFEEPIGTVLFEGGNWNIQSNEIVSGPPFTPGVWFTRLSGAAVPVVGQGIEVQTNPTLASIDAQDGSHYIELDGHPLPSNDPLGQLGNSTIGQYFATTPGTTYRFSFYYSSREGSPFNGVDVFFGDPEDQTFTGFDGPVPVGTWSLVSYFFVATTTQSFVAFGEPLPGDADTLGALIDNVSVTAVPVPAAAWLLGSALLGMFGFRRQRSS